MGKERIDTRSSKRIAARLWNLLTFLILIASACLVLFFISLYRSPLSVLNPFTPEAMVTAHSSTIPTRTIIQQPSTWTPTTTLQSTSTRTRAATWTSLPYLYSKTPSRTLSASPGITETLTTTLTPIPVTYEILYLPSTDIHPAKDCQWLGVGGMVVDANDEPVLLQRVQLGGALGEVLIDVMQLSGNSPFFGESGFEFFLDDQPTASTQTLWIQLFDNTNAMLTEKIYFDTFDDCTRNLVKVKFTLTP